MILDQFLLLLLTLETIILVLPILSICEVLRFILIVLKTLVLIEAWRFRSLVVLVGVWHNLVEIRFLLTILVLRNSPGRILITFLLVLSGYWPKIILNSKLRPRICLVSLLTISLLITLLHFIY